MDYKLLIYCPICKIIPLQEHEGFLNELEYTIKSFEKGEYIAYQGNKINYLYLLTKGRVKTEMVSDTGMVLYIDELKAPYPLAAAFLFADDNHFPVNVIALRKYRNSNDS